MRTMFKEAETIFGEQSELYFPSELRGHCPAWHTLITFYEEDKRGGHVPVGKGVLNDRFFRF